MIKALNKSFGLGQHLRFENGKGKLTRAVLANIHGEAEIYLHGAQLSHYQPKGQAPVIWMSDTAYFSSAKAIRGGVPVCWPWFGAADRPALPQHGFARVSNWCVIASELGPDETIRLSLGLDSVGNLDLWPYPFELTLTLSMGKSLSLAVTMQNKADVALEFGTALHSYLAVGDSRSIRITGLENCDYLDKLDHFALKKQSGDIRVPAGLDRVYINTEGNCVIHDPVLKRRISIGKQGSCSTVVWNPGETGAANMADFDNSGFLKMVCVETANAANDTRILKPLEQHRLVQQISVL